jgi:hypothetical protein
MLLHGKIATETFKSDEMFSVKSMCDKLEFTMEELEFLKTAVQEYMKRGYYHQSDGKTVLDKLNSAQKSI